MSKVLEEYSDKKKRAKKLMKSIDKALEVEEPSITWCDVGDLEHVIAKLEELRTFITGTKTAYQVDCRNNLYGCGNVRETLGSQDEAERYAGHMTVAGFEVEITEVYK